MMAKQNPKVAVLMATYNGKQWLAVQIASILQQEGVDLTLFVSDDSSTDGTIEYIRQLADSDSRVLVLPKTERMGSAGTNFYRLIRKVDVSEFDYVAFADQDDIWHANKLSSHVDLIRANDAEAVSSNVMAFWPDGRQKLIVKSQPQRECDFLFESAGPGCTFLMTPWLVGRVKYQLINNEAAQEVTMHDWLTYAICRAYDKTWIVDPTPSIKYRQHQNNVIGANAGLRAVLARLKKINNGWYRHEVALISRVVASINPGIRFLKFEKIIQSRSVLDQFRLIAFVLEGRRKLIDRLVLILSVLLFIF